MRWMGKGFIYAVLILCGLTMVVPFIWMVTTALKTQTEVNKGNVGFVPVDDDILYNDGTRLHKVKVVKTEGDSAYVHFFDRENHIIKEKAYTKVPQSSLEQKRRLNPHWENFSKAFSKVPFGRYFLNTIITSLSIMIGVIVTGALAAYAFARMEFFGKETLFYLFISMMMVPQPIYLIPSYVLLNHLGWIDTYQALIVPWLANIFTIFLLRQHFKTLPQDLFDAAAIDGCSRFRMLWQIVLPLSKGVISTAAIFSVIGSWNSFMWPLVMTNSENIRVLQVGLSYFSQESSSQTVLLMAASTFSILPLVILFLLAQRQIIQSFASSGLKG